MINFQSPYNGPLFTLDLKNPELGDALTLDTQVLWIKTMNGAFFGYKKTPARKLHNLVFKNLTRVKGLELLKFLQDSHPYHIKYTDKDGTVWQGNITNNPYTLTVTGIGTGQNDYRRESNEITLEFDGVIRQTGLYFDDYTLVYDDSNVLMSLEA